LEIQRVSFLLIYYEPSIGDSYVPHIQNMISLGVYVSFQIHTVMSV